MTRARRVFRRAIAAGWLLRQAETADPDDPFTHGLRHRYNDLEAERRTLDAEITRLRTAAEAPKLDRQGDLLGHLPLATMDLAALPQPVLRTLCEAFRIRITYDHETKRAHHYGEIEAGSPDSLSKLITRCARMCCVPPAGPVPDGKLPGRSWWWPIGAS